MADNLSSIGLYSDQYLNGGVPMFSDALSTAKLLLLGDSITMGSGASQSSKSDPISLAVDGLNGSPKTVYQRGNHWAGRFKAYMEEQYPNVTVLNHGWGGININQLASHMSDFVPNDTTHCIVGLGVNPTSSGGSTTFDPGIATIVNYLRNRNIKIFAWTSWIGCHENLENINTPGRIQAALQHAYNAVGIQPLPVYSIVTRYIEENNISKSSIMEDGSLVHPNDEGHEILYRVIREGFGF